MSKPLESWLSAKLGRNVRLESTETANLLFDGNIFAQLLASYGILTDVSLPKCETAAEALVNLRALNETLGFIGLGLDDSTLSRIAHRDQESAVKLLFEIYIHLEQHWPYSKGAVLGERTSSRHSSEDLERSGSSFWTFQSGSNRNDEHGTELDRDGSLSCILDAYKEDTIAACREEMNAHRTSFSHTASKNK